MATGGRCPRKLCWRDGGGCDQGHTGPGPLPRPFRRSPASRARTPRLGEAQGRPRPLGTQGQLRMSAKSGASFIPAPALPVSGEPPGSGPGTPESEALARPLIPQGSPATTAHSSAGHGAGAGLASKTQTCILAVAGFFPGGRPLPPPDAWAATSTRQPAVGLLTPGGSHGALHHDRGFLPDPRQGRRWSRRPLWDGSQEGAGQGWEGQLSRHPAPFAGGQECRERQRQAGEAS